MADAAPDAEHERPPPHAGEAELAERPAASGKERIPLKRRVDTLDGSPGFPSGLVISHFLPDSIDFEAC